jgi:hypothetical protein
MMCVCLCMCNFADSIQCLFYYLVMFSEFVCATIVLQCEGVFCALYNMWFGGERMCAMSQVLCLYV